MRRWQRLCLALALLMGLIPGGGLAEGGRASTPLADTGQRGNIELAVAALDGTLVKKGETFSFNETVGPRSKENGYVPAINGRGARKLGGGVSQVAATLYLALKRLDGIQYLQKQTYGNQFAGGYVESGYDAVITDFKQNVDFRFVNGYGDFVIRIRATESSVECELEAPDAGSAETPQAGSARSGTESPAPDGPPSEDTGGKEGAAADVASGSAGDAGTASDSSPADGSGGVEGIAPAIPSSEGTAADGTQTYGPGRGGSPDQRVTQANGPSGDDSPDQRVAKANDPGRDGSPDQRVTKANGSGRDGSPDQRVTQVNGPSGDDSPDRDGTPKDLLGVNGGRESPAPEAGGDQPVPSAIEDDPDVAGASRLRITGPAAVLENIQLAASGIYGVVVKRGGTFSFNALVGPNTEEAGYRKAPDGCGDVVVGGGVSVIASALWLAVRDMDAIDVLQKTTYGAAYREAYVDDPDDAIKTDHLEGVDFRFRYKGRGSITIYTYVSEGELICEIRRNNS